MAPLKKPFECCLSRLSTLLVDRVRAWYASVVMAQSIEALELSKNMLFYSCTSLLRLRFLVASCHLGRFFIQFFYFDKLEA